MVFSYVWPRHNGHRTLLLGDIRKMNTVRTKLVLAAALLWVASVYAAAYAPIGFGIAAALILIGVWMVWERVGPLESDEL
jgi:fatty acid desaturase